jgi:hypothetical protein
MASRAYPPGELGFCGFLGATAGLSSGGLFLLPLGRSGPLIELVDSAGSVDELLLAGKQGVAGGTDFDADFRQRGAGGERIAAGAVDASLRIPFGVDLLFHSFCIIAGLARATGPKERLHGR